MNNKKIRLLQIKFITCQVDALRPFMKRIRMSFHNVSIGRDNAKQVKPIAKPTILTILCVLYLIRLRKAILNK